MYVRPALRILQLNDKYLQIVNFTGKRSILHTPVAGTHRKVWLFLSFR